MAVTVPHVCRARGSVHCDDIVWMFTGKARPQLGISGVRNCRAPCVNKNDNRVARVRIGEDDNLVIFFLAKMLDRAVHNSMQVVRLEAHVRCGKPGSRAAVCGVEVSKRHNALFVQALKDFITADSECTLPCWESDSAKHTKCLHVQCQQRSIGRRFRNVRCWKRWKHSRSCERA